MNDSEDIPIKPTSNKNSKEERNTVYIIFTAKKTLISEKRDMIQFALNSKSGKLLKLRKFGISPPSLPVLVAMSCPIFFLHVV